MRDVTVSGLGKAFGAQVVLAGLDLEVPAGSLTAILGPSGSGKTTLLRLLAGFERADTGTIGIGGVLVDGPGAYLPPERRRIGYVPQEGSLFPHLTVAGNVGFGLPAGRRRGGKVDALLETVGLGGFGRRYPHQLSGGQQQRVALARALAIGRSVFRPRLHSSLPVAAYSTAADHAATPDGPAAGDDTAAAARGGATAPSKVAARVTAASNPHTRTVSRPLVLMPLPAQ